MRTWNPAKWHKSELKWFMEQEDFQYVQSVAGLEAIEDCREDYGKATGALSKLSLWYGSKAAVSLYEGRVEEGLQFAAYATLCNDVRSVLMANRQVELPHRPSRSLINQDGITLLRAIAIGMQDNAALTHAMMLYGMSENLYGGYEYTTLGVFALRIMSSYLNLPDPFEEKKIKHFQGYDVILTEWNKEDVSDELVRGLLAACDYHIEQSREITNASFYEISGEEFYLFPVEILAVLRLREWRGLSPVVIDHPLMQFSSAKLYPVLSVPAYPELLVKYMAKLQLQEPALARGLERIKW
jgi:hypothetical protein